MVGVSDRAYAQDDVTNSIVPHRALYEIDLVSTRSGSPVVNVDGEMMYQWKPACEGWNTQHRFHLFYEYTDNPSVKITSDFSTFEGLDRRSLSFSSRRKSDHILLDEYRGHAELGESGGVVTYSIPKDLSHDLSEETILPTQHTAQLISAMRRGDKFFTATVFDGSDETGAVVINGFIGAPVSTGGEASAPLPTKDGIESRLLQSPARNIRLAFFPEASEEATPDYEMDMVFQENGIIREMTIRYDDFSVRQTLKALKKVKGTCQERNLNQ